MRNPRTIRDANWLGIALLGVGTVMSFQMVTAAPRHDRDERSDVKEARQDVREARKEVKQEKKDVRKADTRAERRDARDDVREAKGDLRDAQQDLQREQWEKNHRSDNNRRYDWDDRDYRGNDRRYDWDDHRYDNDHRYDYDHRYNPQYRYDDRYDWSRQSDFRTIEGIVIEDLRGDFFVLRTSSGQQFQVNVRRDEPRRLSRGDRVRVYGFFSNGVFQAQNLSIVRDR